MNIVSLADTADKPHIQVTSGGQLAPGLSIVQSFPDAPANGRIPNINIAEGWAGNGVGSQPITASDGEGMIMDDVSLVRGRHVLQAGALYMLGIKRQTVFTNPQGTFSFSGVHTGDPAADYMLGLDSSYSQASSEREGAFHYRQGEVVRSGRLARDASLNAEPGRALDVFLQRHSKWLSSHQLQAVALRSCAGSRCKSGRIVFWSIARINL